MKNLLKGRKTNGVPKMDNPPPVPKGFKVSGNITGAGTPPKVKIRPLEFHWGFKTFDSNTEARDFINSEMINPKFMYPTGTGKLTIWWTEIVED